MNDIVILPPQVARLIAAGEVIDRPAALVRELLDNSLDAGATTITVDMQRGGIDLLRVIDDGRGMNRDNLTLSVKPHATSKIRTIDDLDRCRSLGFRGEALPSIAAVARLTITSAEQGDGPAHRLTVTPDGKPTIAAVSGRPGTAVQVENLFFNFPARRRSLRQASSEAAQCRAMFIEKALAFPTIAMRLMTGGQAKLTLPEGSAQQRVLNLFPDLGDQALLYHVQGSGDGYTLQALAADPGITRRDRKRIMIFVNGRLIREYALVQAVEYAYSPYMPGGKWPTTFIFLDIDPALIDFNIHPAKREVRLRNLPDIHHHITTLLTNQLRRVTQRQISIDNKPVSADSQPTLHHQYSPEPQTSPSNAPAGHPAARSDRAADYIAEPVATKLTIREQQRDEPSIAPPIKTSPQEFRYLGQIFNLFLLVEIDQRLLIIDQHAAHEKVLFERYRRSGTIQQLLVPIRIEVSQEQEHAMQNIAREWRQLGLEITSTAAGLWLVTSVPEALLGKEERLPQVFNDMLNTPQKMQRDFYALMACHAAIREGEPLDHQTAQTLVADTMQLTDGRCPHGRPIWFELSERELQQFVGRL